MQSWKRDICPTTLDMAKTSAAVSPTKDSAVSISTRIINVKCQKNIFSFNEPSFGNMMGMDKFGDYDRKMIDLS